MAMPEYVYCIGCGEYFGDDMGSKPQHVCQFPDDDDFCGHCGAELNDRGSCDNDHNEEWQAPESPAKGDLKGILAAVLHQMEHGEASDLFDLGIGIDEDIQRDLRWCREQLREAIKLVTS